MFFLLIIANKKNEIKKTLTNVSVYIFYFNDTKYCIKAIIAQTTGIAYAIIANVLLELLKMTSLKEKLSGKSTIKISFKFAF